MNTIEKKGFFHPVQWRKNKKPDVHALESFPDSIYDYWNNLKMSNKIGQLALAGLGLVYFNQELLTTFQASALF
jgi:hypothetical protein